jgi:hypothetical protein
MTLPNYLAVCRCEAVEICSPDLNIFQLMFESRDTGHTQCLENTVHKIINLKKGCNVMLIYNVPQRTTKKWLSRKVCWSRK